MTEIPYTLEQHLIEIGLKAKPNHAPVVLPKPVTVIEFRKPSFDHKGEPDF